MNNSKYTTLLTMVFIILLAGVVITASRCTKSQDVTSGTTPSVQPNMEKAMDTDVSPKPEPTGPHPKIEFQEVAYDFGKQIAGTELKHSFSFKNTGTETLVIDKVKAG
jgi:hypothetical protein